MVPENLRPALRSLGSTSAMAPVTSVVLIGLLSNVHFLMSRNGPVPATPFPVPEFLITNRYHWSDFPSLSYVV